MSTVHIYIYIYIYTLIIDIKESTCSSSLELFLKCGDNLPPHQWVSVSLLLSILRDQLAKAQVNLLTASVKTPLYGVMQSIRTTLEEAKDMCGMCVCLLCTIFFKLELYINSCIISHLMWYCINSKFSSLQVCTIFCH